MAGESEGLVIAVLTRAFRMSDTPKSTKELPFSHFSSLSKPNRSTKMTIPDASEVLKIMTLEVKIKQHSSGNTLPDK